MVLLFIYEPETATMLERAWMGAEKLMARSDGFQSPLHRHKVGGGVDE
jgi:D-lyxose ketol-isomerase